MEADLKGSDCRRSTKSNPSGSVKSDLEAQSLNLSVSHTEVEETAWLPSMTITTKIWPPSLQSGTTTCIAADPTKSNQDPASGPAGLKQIGTGQSKPLQSDRYHTSSIYRRNPLRLLNNLIPSTSRSNGRSPPTIDATQGKGHQIPHRRQKPDGRQILHDEMALVTSDAEAITQKREEKRGEEKREKKREKKERREHKREERRMG